MLNVGKRNLAVYVRAAPSRKFRRSWDGVDGFIDVIVGSVIEDLFLKLVCKLDLGLRYPS